MKTQEEKYQYIGSKIKEARDAAKISQMGLATAVGFESATAILLLEAGKRQVSISDLEKIAKFLNRDIKFFLGDEEKRDDIKVALRADKDLTAKDKETILHFIELAKKGKDGK
jgi:transcriptional regulator with XRE-family HTH domain